MKKQTPKNESFAARFQSGPTWLPFRKNRVDKEYVSPTVMLLFWMTAFADHYFTPQGRLLAVAYLPISFYSLLLARSPAVMLFFLLTLLFLIDLLAKIVFPRSIQVIRRPPSRTICGTPFEIRTEIVNDSFLPGFDILVDSSMSTKEFVPEERSVPKLQIPAKSRMELRRRFTILKRGIYELPPAVAESLFPFGLVKARRQRGNRQEIICHPFHTELNSIRLPDGSSLHHQSMSSTPSIGDSMDFYGCREYRDGDDPRKIHWSASAKHNRLVVKEFQEEKLSSAAVILDNLCPSPVRKPLVILKNLVTLKPILPTDQDVPFEAAVSLTASLANSLSAHHFVVDVFAAGSEIHHFRTGRNTMTREAFLDLLASLGYTRSYDRFCKLTPSLLNQIASTGAVFLILLNIDEESEKLYKNLLKHGAAVRAFLVSSSPGPEWVETISAEELLKGGNGRL
ncbi:MAG: hypothetical protein BWY31_03037 [Lentisphaerae bacterium ADurb.Bin242]|nr:MAG: hypothetical protein BWY31_03037 [Lentisphaerae bacterium ADurb.Bin242]